MGIRRNKEDKKKLNSGQRKVKTNKYPKDSNKTKNKQESK